MREDRGLCTRFRFHKQKLVFFLSAMRHHANELRDAGFDLHYEKLGTGGDDYLASLKDYLKKQKIKELLVYEVEDKFFETDLMELTKELKISLKILPSPMFLTTRTQFEEYLGRVKKPFMKTFYEGQRKRLKVLLDEKGKPLHGKWSFDEDNRLPLPLDNKPPALPRFKANAEEKDLIALITKEFPDHPGEADGIWLPSDREGAKAWLDDFLKKRFHDFGPYEDALAAHSDFVYHSVLTPYLNVGLLTPADVLKKAIAYADKHDIPYPSLEGFVRQILGWREFIRGVYQNFSEKQDQGNYWKHKGKLSELWYQGNTGIPPLDQVLDKTLRYSHAHHIERLMVVGNLMLLLGIDPKEAHRWFMEMFIDSSDWVMGPNVYGMALFSDGGIFATKPYICGSNYYRKMGAYKTGEWQDGVDGLYWGFIAKHREFFSSNPRLGMTVRTLDRMDGERMKKIAKAAEALKARLVVEA